MKFLLILCFLFSLSCFGQVAPFLIMNQTINTTTAVDSTSTYLGGIYGITAGLSIQVIYTGSGLAGSYYLQDTLVNPSQNVWDTIANSTQTIMPTGGHFTYNITGPSYPYIRLEWLASSTSTATVQVWEYLRGM
jgi:hypothetical protein